MKHFYDSVLQVRSGLTIPAPGVSITVNVQGTQTAATIYSDDGITTKANPLATDTNGRFDFYIANGRYDLIFAGTGFANFTQFNVEITDAMDTTALGKTPIAFTAANTHSGRESFTGNLNIPSGAINPASCTAGDLFLNTASGSLQICISTNVFAGTGIAPNTPLPAATSGPGPVFNVKNYGALGNTQASNNCSISGLTNLNCTDVTFTAANVGQHVSCSASNQTVFLHGDTDTFTAFVDAHNMTVSRSNGPSGVSCLWGTPDDAAVTAAVTAALAQACVPVGTVGNLCTSTSSPTVYFPAGAYNLAGSTQILIDHTPARSGFAVRGDGRELTKIYWHANATNANAAAMQVTGNMQNVNFSGFTLDGGAQGGQSFANGALSLSGNSYIFDVRVQRFFSPLVVATAGIYANRLDVVAGNNGAGFTCSACSGEVYESVFSNNQGPGILIQNAFGLTGGPGFRLVNSLIDENAGAGGTLGCSVQVVNSSDVWFQGSAIFSSSSAPLCSLGIDGTSFVHWSGGVTGMFGTTEPNRNGIKVLAGGLLQMSDVRATGSGTGNCINNAGVINDNGGNSCESAFPINSGTSTGTAAVLTVSTTNGANANVNCAVGDALFVEGAAIAGYNGYYPAGTTSGITAVTATTISYTTAGSNLGALGAGGVAFCRNLLTYTGNLPKALLNNPIPNTCNYVITPIANATTVTLCNFSTGSATNITRIRASSQATTTCATPPIITISDGTVSQTLTLTSGKNSWDSSVDASTGVGTTIFKPNGTITVKYDVAANSACATPATNLAISYNITPILSN